MQSKASYLRWVARFYQGWALAPTGWLAVERQTLEGVHPGRRSVLAHKLARLGRRIAAEWAKHEQVRRIDTRSLMVWAGVAREAQGDGREELVIERIARDVEALLSGELHASEVERARYADLLETSAKSASAGRGESRLASGHARKQSGGTSSGQSTGAGTPAGTGGVGRQSSAPLGASSGS